MATSWRNWAGNQRAKPSQFLKPHNENDVVDAVRAACDMGGHVKVVGSGHSFTAAAVGDGVMMDIGALSGIHRIDHESMTVTVGAGTTLSSLNQLLAREGLAMPNLGDIAYQTVAGAISTSTHGTGARLPGLAAQVVGLRLVDGQANVVDTDLTHQPDLLQNIRVSVGSVGVLTQVTLKVVKSFRLHAVEQPMRVVDVLNNIDELRESNDHFEFFWIPHTKWALTKRNNRTELPLSPLPKVKGWFEKTFMENYAFGAVCHLGKMRPSLIPRLATALPSSGERTYVDDSYKIFASPRIVRFYEMEYSIPRDSLPNALRDVQSMVDRKGYLLNFPVEVRFTAPDDVPLSTSFGRDSAYIAVHVFKGMEYEPYFRDVEKIMRDYEGRPHWGKLHFRGVDELSALYPRFSDFLQARQKLDPGRVFENDYSRRVFG